MFDFTSVRFRGPLVAYAGSYWAALMSQGYSPGSAMHLMFVASHMSRWLKNRRIRLDQLTDDHVTAFLAHRRRKGYRAFCSLGSTAPLLDHLRDIGAVPPSKPAVARTPMDHALIDYATFLARERSLAPSTIRLYTDTAKRFIAQRFGSGSLRWSRLCATDITPFIVGQSRSMGSRKLDVTALRSFLRFLHFSGRVKHDLASGVPAVPRWKLAWLPKPLDDDQLNELLELPDQRTSIGLRDAAMIRLLFRLGLRVGDVADLELDSIDWRAGEIVVRGKTARESRLPLPPDVGQAVATYLRRGRPRVDVRNVFIRSRAPLKGLTRGGVLSVVIRALRRVGAAAGGAHVLRQTTATQLLRRGASLSEIAHVLRHRSVDATAIYTKVDHAALRTLARRWPGGAA